MASITGNEHYTPIIEPLVVWDDNPYEAYVLLDVDGEILLEVPCQFKFGFVSGGQQ